jgi:hypothetical protein
VPSRFQLRGGSLEGIEWKLFNAHGTSYRIVSAEKVTEGGLAGFFAKRFYEVTVEIPDGAPGAASVRSAAAGSAVAGAGQASGKAAGKSDGGQRTALAAGTPAARTAGRHAGVAGIEALLRLADDTEALEHGEDPAPRVSTGSAVFAELLDNLDLEVGSAAAGLPAAGAAGSAEAAGVPDVAYWAGALVLVAGLGEDALNTARSFTAELGPAELRTAGNARAAGVAHLSGRNGITVALAAAAKAGRAVVVAFGVGSDGTVSAAALSDFEPDQVWVAVDATRKATDTAIWVRRMSWALRTDAVAVLGSANTLTPGTVNDLDIPIGWVDGRPALSPEL